MNWNNLSQNSIILHLKSMTKEPAIHELLARAPIFREVRDLEKLKRAILSREKVMSTGLGRGVAISHGETRELPGVVVALGLSDEGIDFDAVDKNPVHILFVVANSKRNRAEYLEVLSDLTKLMRKDDVRAEIRCCSCCSEVEQVLHDAARRALASA